MRSSDKCVHVSVAGFECLKEILMTIMCVCFNASLPQIVQVHQETVDLYLEDVILETLEQTADQQAREEIRRRAKQVNDIAYAMEER